MKILSRDVKDLVSCVGVQLEDKLFVEERSDVMGLINLGVQL